MGRRNYLVEGVSATGKTSVCEELGRRGHHAVHGDRELAYQGDPATGAAVEGRSHEHHLWRVEAVRALVADHEHAVTFFCGGSRNSTDFIDLFDAVFVLQVDLDTLNRRLDQRPHDEWGAAPFERELVVRLHQTGEDTPVGIVIDATVPVARVVDEILRLAARDPLRLDEASAASAAADPPRSSTRRRLRSTAPARPRLTPAEPSAAAAGRQTASWGAASWSPVLPQLATEHGAQCATVPLPVDRQTQWARIRHRWQATPHETHPMTRPRWTTGEDSSAHRTLGRASAG